MARLLETEGPKGSMVYHINDGFYYHAHRKDNTRFYLKCIHRTMCHARASVPPAWEDQTAENFKILCPHNHDPDPTYFPVLKLRSNIMRRCRNESTRFKKIFDEESSRVDILVASQLEYKVLISAMRRQRFQKTNEIPTTLTEFGEMIIKSRYKNCLDGGAFYDSTVVDKSTGEASVIFISPYLAAQLNDCKTLMIDTTFNVLPDTPPNIQLLTILAIYFDQAFPIATALMQSKSKATYNLVIGVLKERYPSFKPEMVITDFEEDLHEAVVENFPSCQVTGCWLHYANRILQAAIHLGYATMMKENDVAARVVKMCTALALLPVIIIPEGFTYIKNYAKENEVEEVLDVFLKHFNKYWMEGFGPLAFCVYGQKQETNCDVKTYHQMLFKKILQDINIWVFTDALLKTEQVYRQRHMNLKQGISTCEGAYVLSDKKIIFAIEKFEKKKYTIGEFLQVTSHVLDTYHNGLSTNTNFNSYFGSSHPHQETTNTSDPEFVKVEHLEELIKQEKVEEEEEEANRL